MKSRVEIIKSLLAALYDYISETYTQIELENRRERLHEIVDDVCDEFICEIRGLKDV